MDWTQVELLTGRRCSSLCLRRYMINTVFALFNDVVVRHHHFHSGSRPDEVNRALHRFFHAKIAT